LEFEFEPAFVLLISNGTAVATLGLVREFGSRSGTLLFAESSVPSDAEQAEIRSLGYFISLLFPTYFEYDEELFKDTLNDWGYFGHESRRPGWCSS